jgi:hypothetical protein
LLEHFLKKQKKARAKTAKTVLKQLAVFEGKDGCMYENYRVRFLHHLKIVP